MTFKCEKCREYNPEYFKDEDGKPIVNNNCENCGESRLK